MYCSEALTLGFHPYIPKLELSAQHNNAVPQESTAKQH